MYVTPAQLAEKPGATEISQVATSEHAAALVDPALMLATLRDEPRDAWEPGEIAEADEALARVNQAIEETDALVDAYIRKRVTAVPVLPVPSILTRIARAIVRYELHRHRISDANTDPIARDYRDAIKTLEAIRDGKVTLGGTDPAAAGHPGPGDVRFESDPPVFGRDEMRSFR